MSIWFIALLDDIAVLLDDTAVMTKVSMNKTAGILGDDLAVNAEKAAGFSSDKELPILWRITKWAIKNKLIILPLAFLLSAFVPWTIAPILILGWLYLAFEWTEKIHEAIEYKILKKSHDVQEIILTEEEKVKSAILTDFILSIEIIILTLSTVTAQVLPVQIMVVSIIAFIATFGVYGIVALLVRMDDVGFHFMKDEEEGSIKYKFWNFLVKGLPLIVKTLWIVGTWAMLLVAWGIFSHKISFFHHIHTDYIPMVPAMVYETILGFTAGYILVLVFFIGRKFYTKK